MVAYGSEVLRLPAREDGWEDIRVSETASDPLLGVCVRSWSVLYQRRKTSLRLMINAWRSGDLMIPGAYGADGERSV